MSAGDGVGHALLLVAVDALVRGVAGSAGGEAVLSDAEHVGGKAGGALLGQPELSDEAGSGAGGGGEAAGGALVELAVHGVLLHDEDVEVLRVVAADLTSTEGDGEEGEESKEEISKLHYAKKGGK